MPNYQAVPGNNQLWRVVDHDNDLIVAWRCAQEDACLFAAAPEMLDFLYELAVMRTESIPADLQAQASALIRKAEGRND